MWEKNPHQYQLKELLELITNQITHTSYFENKPRKKKNCI